MAWRFVSALVGVLRWLRRPVILCLGLLLLAPVAALAAVTTSPHLLVANPQFWTLLLGSVIPLVGYVLNKYAPWISEPVKGGVQVVLAAVASAIYAAVATNVIGWNTATFELILSGVVGALAAHKLLWLPSGISTLLGGGSNAPARKRAGARRRS